jgi:purine-binding chemotaxis protein CheW
MGQKNTARQTQRARSHEYLTFQLNGEAYGIDILKVQEIRSYEPPTKIANAPPHIKGIINLRGVIVSVVDLRIKFNEAQVHGDLPIDSTTVVIVLNVREHVIGVVVDAVCDVMQLSESAIQPAPDIRSSVMDTSYIVGIAKVNDRLLILMDIEALMSSPDMGLLGAMPSHSAE